nr:alpha/beta fold hydrolase [[Clostridium] colinum]
MKKDEFYYKSSDELTNIHCVNWIANEIKCILQIAHGMVEHIERYEDFAKFLNNYGILVVGNDHLGHGKSISCEENFGYFSEKNGNNNVIKDMYYLTKITKEKYPNLPYIFLGHSMGSFLLRQYLCEYGNEIDGAIIMGTGNEYTLHIKGGIALINKIASQKGWRYRSEFIDKAVFAGFNKKFEPSKTGKEWLTRDEKIIQKYIEDKRCNFIFTLNGYYNLLYGIEKLSNKNYLNKMPKDLPILFVSGDKDPVGNFGKSVLSVFKTFKKIGMKNVECKLYEGFRHEILNEIGKKEVYNDILNWIIKILK